MFVAIITALLTARLYPENATPSLVGLAINYTLLVPIYLNWVVKLLSDMEMYIGAVERIAQYVEGPDLDHGRPATCTTRPNCEYTLKHTPAINCIFCVFLLLDLTPPVFWSYVAFDILFCLVYVYT